jgi:hypothetical protein
VACDQTDPLLRDRPHAVSFEATNWAYRLPLKGSVKPLLVALADYADEAGSCYPGQEKLALMTGLSTRTLRRAIERAERLGLLTRERRFDPFGHRTSDRYFLHLDVESLPANLTTGQSDLRSKTSSLPAKLVIPTGHSVHVSIRGSISDPPGGQHAPDPTPEAVDNPTTATSDLVPWCKRHATTEGTDRPCAACARAKTLWSAQMVADSRTNVWQAAGRKSKLDPTTHCEHGQFIGKCDTCAYEERKAAEIITQQFGERA